MKTYKIFSISGRATRREFWCYFILSLMVTSAFLNVMFNAISVVSFYTGGIIGCAGFYIGSAVTVRRLHDIGLSGYLSIILIGSWALNIVFSLLLGMPTTIQHFKTIYGINSLILVTFILYLGCKKSENNDNKYGPVTHHIIK
ncbi:DUF805 domain-containing protein [Succinatimonas hippei]|uniref:DUF805 domain-containing protein n=1 Tax=Succinatimonas hippei TaxID=626938 RepID=UPI003D1769AC